MAGCASCGAELPAGARFCAFCGTAVSEAPAPAAERRTVTILFVDLVGFTERSDRADPEDVRRTLVPFHRRVKEELEAFGGTLDKFIGDAVMGVFGAPVAHEDDPERAVLAALRILDSLDELRALDPDIAVNSGEAVVSFGTGPQVGEAVAGDVVVTYKSVKERTFVEDLSAAGKIGVYAASPAASNTIRGDGVAVRPIR